ncbi:DNA/RNA non-specific endonuclease [Catenisphaera adipataccumulans]|uniref:DNA-entry nuclease n=1 Tax=Catenisphaera adipataccumulans TaxID=700500 RepID=A0A7W8CXI6_9FIRM|nr:DNA/RNA non-specific endonuclease [Catenisphaera adipataccumulans]MBB5183447.1 DNA-entry nuclease [Catenisphaera adipataccumulans]
MIRQLHRLRFKQFGAVLFAVVCIFGCLRQPIYAYNEQPEGIPAYTGSASVEVDNNVPSFKKSELKKSSYKKFKPLDEEGRCQAALADIGLDLMPTAKRKSIGMIKPSGWHLVKYDNIDGKYLYNRCHLIGYQLCGENANARNLITGTRYMNVDGMLPFENQIADFVEATEQHVAYRVTPIFIGDNLVASGVEMEAQSVEDHGSGLQFDVYCYNVQPGIDIDYATGDSQAQAQETAAAPDADQDKTYAYILNKNTGVFHRPECRSVSLMSEKNKEYYNGTRADAIAQGYRPCQNCDP